MCTTSHAKSDPDEREAYCCWAAHANAGVKGRRIRELTSVVQKRFKFPEGTVELYAEKVNNRGLCAIAQAESLRYKLLGGLAVRRCAWCLLCGCACLVAASCPCACLVALHACEGHCIT